MVKRGKLFAAMTILGLSSLAYLPGAESNTLTFGRPVATIPASASCTPYTIQSVTYLTTDGSATTASDTTAGMVIAETGPTGSTITFETDPAGLAPATASAAELKLWNIPARPTDASSLAAWLDIWGGVRKAMTDIPIGCSSTELSGAVAGGTPASFPDTANWSGRLIQGVSVSQVTGVLTQPGFSSNKTCGTMSTSAHGSWVGIGGYSSRTKLLQNGIVSIPSQYQPVSFWQAVPDYPTSQLVYEGSGLGGDENDHLAFVTAWTGSTGQYTWTNVTKNISMNAIDGGSRNDYDSSSAEWIDEAPEDIGGKLNTDNAPYFQFRRPDESSNWGGERYNGSTPAGSASTQSYIYMTVQGLFDKPALGQSVNVNTTASQNQWQGCQ